MAELFLLMALVKVLERLLTVVGLSWRGPVITQCLICGIRLLISSRRGGGWGCGSGGGGGSGLVHGRDDSSLADRTSRLGDARRCPGVRSDGQPRVCQSVKMRRGGIVGEGRKAALVAALVLVSGSTLS